MAMGAAVLGFLVAAACFFPAGLGAAGLWLGLACGLIVTGNLLAWRFFKLTARAAPVRHPFEDKDL